MENTPPKYNSERYYWMPLRLGGKLPVSPGWSKKNVPQLDALNVKSGELLIQQTHPNLNLCNWGIITGKLNDIFILDLDDYKWDLDNCSAVRGEEDGIHPFIKEFGNDYQNCFNTYTILTARGGTHLYFKYDSDIKQLEDGHNQIDIRSDGGYIIGHQSSIEECYYCEIDDAPVAECPPKLKEWILKNLSRHKGGNNSKPPTKAQLARYAKTKDRNVGYTYNIDDATILKIIDRLPDGYADHYGTWLKLTTVLKTLDKKHIWTQISKRAKNYDEYKNETHWDNVNGDGYPLVKSILKQANCSGLLPYIKFKPVLKNNEKPDRIITRHKLGINELGDQEDFIGLAGDHKWLIVKSDTGTGKTTATKKYFGRYNVSFTSIVSRISLGQEQHRTFNDFGLECAFYKDQYMSRQGDNYVTTIDSLFKKCSNPYITWEDYNIYMDEFGSLIKYLFTATTMANKRIFVFLFLLKILERCKKVIMTDADIDDTSFMFIKHMTNDYYYIKNEFVHNKGVKAIEYTDEEEFKKRLKSLDKFVVCTDSKTLADNYGEFLNDPTVEIWTKDYKGEMIMDNHDKLIYSPKITTGLDSSMKREVFVIMKEESIDPETMLQQIARSRNILRVNFLFTKKKVGIPKYKSLADCEAQLREDEIFARQEFGMTRATPEETELFFKINARYKYNQDAHGTNKFGHMLNLLQKRGFDVITKGTTTCFNTKDHLKMAKDRKLKKMENFNPCDKEHLQLNKILKFTDTDIMVKYKELFLDENARDAHFRIIKFMLKPAMRIRQHLCTKNWATDFKLNTIKSVPSKILWTLNFIKAVNPSHTDLTVRPEIKNTLTEEQSKRALYGFERIFSSRMKKKIDLTQIHDCNKLLNKCYASLLRPILIKEENIDCEINGKKKRYARWAIDKEALQRHMDIYKWRSTPKPEFLPEDKEAKAEWARLHNARAYKEAEAWKKKKQDERDTKSLCFEKWICSIWGEGKKHGRNEPTKTVNIIFNNSAHFLPEDEAGNKVIKLSALKQTGIYDFL